MQTTTGTRILPVPPVARTIDIVGNDVVVTGQSFVLNGSITDLPNGATPQLQWEVTDAGGNIVAVGWQGRRWSSFQVPQALTSGNL